VTIREYGGKQCCWPTIQPGSNFSKKKINDNFHNEILVSELSLGLMWILDPEWAEQNGGGKKLRQNSKTSPFVFIFFPFAFHLDLLKPVELVQY